MTDPGPESWARQGAQLVVIDAMKSLIDAEPDRFTGVKTDTSARVTLYVIDPGVLDEPPFARLLVDADRERMAITIAPGVRPLRELNRIMDDILRTQPFESLGAFRAGWWIDPPTGTVQVQVAEVAVEAVRAAFAGYGDAVVVLSVGPPDLTIRLPRHSGSRAGWPVPTASTDSVVGQPTDATTRRYQDDGFAVEIHHLGHPLALNADLRPGRIRLLVHEGAVVDASQG